MDQWWETGNYETQSRLKENRPLLHQYLSSPYNLICWSDGDISLHLLGTCSRAVRFSPQAGRASTSDGMSTASPAKPAVRGDPGRQQAKGPRTPRWWSTGLLCCSPRAPGDSPKPLGSSSVKQGNPGSLPHRELVATTHTLKHGANGDFWVSYKAHTPLLQDTS